MNAISKYRARALTVEEKEECFADARSYAGEVHAMARTARRAGWVVGSVGVGVGVVGVLAVIVLLPLKSTEVRYMQVETSTGWVSETVGAVEAPKLFNEATAENYLRQYIEAREGYVPVTDDLMFNKTAVMSSPEEQTRYAAAHKGPMAPRTILGKNGYIRVQNFHFVPQGAGKAKTQVYLVRFDRVEVRGDTVGIPKPYGATVQFQWHPELVMRSEDRQINPAGLQVIAYKAEAEGTQ